MPALVVVVVARESLAAHAVARARRPEAARRCTSTISGTRWHSVALGGTRWHSAHLFENASNSSGEQNWSSEPMHASFGLALCCAEALTERPRKSARSNPNGGATIANAATSGSVGATSATTSDPYEYPTSRSASGGVSRERSMAHAARRSAAELWPRPMPERKEKRSVVRPASVMRETMETTVGSCMLPPSGPHGWQTMTARRVARSASRPCTVLPQH